MKIRTMLLAMTAWVLISPPVDAALIGSFGKHVSNSSYGAGDAIVFSLGYADRDLNLAAPVLFSEILTGDTVAALNSGGAFALAARKMANGAPESIATTFQFLLAGELTGNAGGAGFPETDFAGYLIDEFVLTISNFALLSPGSDPNGDGEWADLTFDWRVDVYGIPESDIPLPPALWPFLAGAGGLAAARLPVKRRFGA